VTVGLGDHLTWSVALRGKVIVAPSRLGMTLASGPVLGAKPVVSATRTRAVDQVLRPVVRIKRAEVRDRFNERRVDFAGGYALIVRAYGLLIWATNNMRKL
jgi:alpha-glucosidase